MSKVNQETVKKSRTNLKEDIDIAIINEIDKNEPLAPSDLKRNIEKVLGRPIVDRTYYDHLRRLIARCVIKKQDYGIRGKKSVFYLLTNEAKNQKHLRIIETDPKCDSFKQIYLNLLFKALAKGQLIETRNLGDVPPQLQIIDKDDVPLLMGLYGRSYRSLRSINLGHEQTTLNELKDLLSFGLLHALPNTEGLRIAYIIETIYSAEGKRVKYKILLPGTSISHFVTSLNNFNPNIEDAKAAFEILLKNQILEPLTEFNGESIYHIRDEKLNHLVSLLSFYYILENFFQLYIQENTFEGVEHDTKKRKKLFVSTEASLEFKKVFDLRELSRYKTKQEIIKRTSKNYFRETKETAVELFHKFFVLIASFIQEECKKTVEEYSFLSNIFQIACPFLFEKLPSLGERPDVEFLNQFQFLANKLKTYLAKMIA